MGLERYVVDAVVLEGRSPSDIARLHSISLSWLDRLLDRYHEGGYAADAPRSRRPRSCTHQTAPELEARSWHCGPSSPPRATTPARRRSSTISAASSPRRPRRRRSGGSCGATT